MSGRGKKVKQTFVPRVHSRESSSAKWYMFTYKVGDGRRAIHVREGLYSYGAVRCTKLFNRVGRCPRGNACRFAHSSLEILFHPLVYKTSRCSQTRCPKGESCAWSHSGQETRKLDRILGWDWRSYDPISRLEKRAIREKKQLREGKKNLRVKIGERSQAASEEDCGTASVSNMSASQTNVSSRTAMSISSGSGAMDSGRMMKEQEEGWMAVERMGEQKEEAVTVTMNEFERWYREQFDCEVVHHSYYLRRFQRTNLDDLDLLWELFLTSEGKKNKKSVCPSFVELMEKEIGMVDEAFREEFARRLCEYKCPMDAGGWLERVVGLGQYADLILCGLNFGRKVRVYEVVRYGVDDDDLSEMGVSLAGHRAKILLCLKQVEEE